MENEKLTRLLKQYAEDSISQMDKKALFDYFEHSYDIKNIENVGAEEWEVLSIDHELDAEASEMIFRNIVGSPEKMKVRRRFTWVKWAAILLISGLAAVYFLNIRPGNIPAGQAIVKAMIRGEHEKIVLPDGSTVVLNSNSKLEYPTQFTGKKREVFLSGEGYFDVKHNASMPFIVHSGNLSTTVLGTAFNIKTIDHDRTIVVTVTRGKVSVSRDDKLLGILTPNQQITSAKAEKILPKVKVVAAQETIEWQANDIFFKDVTMQNAMYELSKRFNVKISFLSEAGKDCRLTATFLKGETLDEILKVISAFNGAEIKRKDGGEITVAGKSCTN